MLYDPWVSLARSFIYILGAGRSRIAILIITSYVFFFILTLKMAEIVLMNTFVYRVGLQNCNNDVIDFC